MFTVLAAGNQPLIAQTLSSLSLISILLIAALGLGIIFGLMRVVNLAHGAFITLGAYTAYAVNLLDGGVLLSFVLAPLIVGFFGVLVEQVIVKGRYKKPVEVVLATWGVAIVIRQLIKIIFGQRSKTVPTPDALLGNVVLSGISVSIYRLFIFTLALVLFAGTIYVFFRTPFGVQSRAVVQNKSMSSALGVNTDRINTVSFAIGSGLAGLAGAVLAPLAGANPTLGLSYLLESFFVVTISGIGNLTGIFLVSVALGGIKSWLSFFHSIALGQIIEFLVAIILIMIVQRETGGESL